MFVNYQINITTLNSGTTATTINIPLNMEYQLVDQAELVDRVFVDVETKKAINPIVDYEKVRFTPVDKQSKVINNIIYNVNTISGSTYAANNFTDDDIRFKRETVKQTFLNLNFYDGDNPMTQNLISNITLYSELNQLQDSNTPISYVLQNPILNPRGFAEGYYIYDYKDELKVGETKYLYMRASFKNAKDGTTTNMMVKDTALPIDELVHQLYTRFVLFRNQTGYYFSIDDSYQGSTANTQTHNVTYTSNGVVVDLYQIKAL